MTPAWPLTTAVHYAPDSRPECNALMGSRVSWGQPEVKLLRNAIWLLGVRRGQPEGNCWDMHRGIKFSQCCRALCSCRCSSTYKIKCILYWACNTLTIKICWMWTYSSLILWQNHSSYFKFYQNAWNCDMTFDRKEGRGEIWVGNIVGCIVKE